MNIKDTGIWHTIEMTCAAQGFTYEDYKDLHERSGYMLDRDSYV